MTAWPEHGRHSLVAAALAKAEAWLLAPEHEPPAAERVPAPPPPPRRVVAVLGLAPRSGATAIARALAVELALRDPAGAAVVASRTAAVAPLAIGGPASSRLARRLREIGCEEIRCAGRLCLVGDAAAQAPRLAAERPAPLVLDAGRDGTGAGFADRMVLVAGPGVEPALAQVVAASLERTCPPPAVIANRAEERARWEAAGAVVVGESRLAAHVALAGREPRGQLGALVRGLVDRWEREEW